ncbi:radical SAM protein [Desulfobacula sp.]|uniref:radical SAM/SPASM domain-containing protein n=1 Tax=Desulfobacula sp. TaxID=2593537 RepID=UPI00261623B3|nr:radical SAM protein [Desulfobacula sp.]
MKNIKQFETKHFLILYSGNSDYLFRNFSDFMEDVYQSLSLKFLSPIDQKITVYTCKNREEFQEFWGPSAMPDWPDAFVFSSNLLIIDPQKIRQLDSEKKGSFKGMAHELSHIFLGQMACQLPIWLEEGLCEYFSKPDLERSFLLLCRHKKIYGFNEIEMLSRQSLLDLDDSTVKENICYRQSHSFVSYLIRLKGETYFMDCVSSIGLDSTFKIRFQKLYHRSIEDVEQEWQKKYPQIQVAGLKPSKNLRIIKNASIVLLYNAFYGQSLKSSPDILFLIEAFKNGATLNEISENYDIKNFYPIITALYDKRLLVFDCGLETNQNYRNFDQEHITKGKLINKLRLNISNLCNMACDYCYIDPCQKEQMDWHTAKKALTLFFDLQKRFNRNHCQIRFFGGEAMLNWPVIEKIFEYLKYLKNGIRVEYILNTNGTIVTEKIARKLALNNVNISVSLDGLRKVHDTFRTFKSGKGTFSVINKNIDILVSSGCEVAISATIGDHNYNHLKELITYIADKNNEHNASISLSLQSMCMESKQGLDTVPVDEKVKVIREAVLYAIEIGVNVGFGMLMFPLNALLGVKTMGAYCNAVAGEEICIFPNGDIYPCGTLKIKMGNIENFDAIFKTKDYLNLVKRVAGNIPTCNGCDIEAFCAGGCAADAFQDGGNIFFPTKNCQFEQLFFKSIVMDYLNEVLE